MYKSLQNKCAWYLNSQQCLVTLMRDLISSRTNKSVARQNKLTQNILEKIHWIKHFLTKKYWTKYIKIKNIKTKIIWTKNVVTKYIGQDLFIMLTLLIQ